MVYSIQWFIPVSYGLQHPMLESMRSICRRKGGGNGMRCILWFTTSYGLHMYPVVYSILWFTASYGLQHPVVYSILWFTASCGLQHPMVYSILWLQHPMVYSILWFTASYGLQHPMVCSILWFTASYARYDWSSYALGTALAEACHGYS